MLTTPRILRALPLLLPVIFVACSQTARMSEDRETEYIRMLREEFFKTHPNGQYNEYIARGEVVKGMDFLEVLSSWGNPSKREKPSENVEYWIYTEEDEDSKDWFEYKFVFRKSILEEWELNRHIAAGGLLNVTGQQNRDVLKKGGTGKFGTGTDKKR
jgi:hypothetical protein